jgi:hypothetical protein
MKMKNWNGKMVAAVCATALFVAASSLAYAQQESQHKKRKNVYQAQQQVNMAQNTNQAMQQVDRALYERRMADYRQHLAVRRQAVQQSVEAVRRAQRSSHYQYQQQYSNQMHEQWNRYDDSYFQNYRNDPFFRTPFDHRYYRNGVYYETNHFGIEHINQAIQLGYAEGYQAGMADRRDRWRSDYERSEGYIDADYGYNGYYVSMDDYNYFFRQGFRRGYEDGYNSRYRYGRFSNGRYTILDSVLRGIFKFEVFRR